MLPIHLNAQQFQAAHVASCMMGSRVTVFLCSVLACTMNLYGQSFKFRAKRRAKNFHYVFNKSVMDRILQ